MVTIIFESHCTTIDNATKKASGHFDVELSDLGIEQAKELGKRHAQDNFAAIFCSDLQRSYKTAEIAFEGRNFKIIKDKRLRECDYGDLTQHPSAEVEAAKAEHITAPFPNGESYEQCCLRMKSFLQDVSKNYADQKIMIIGHRATQYGLENCLNGVSVKDAVTAPWQWQPGWEYKLEKI